MYLIIILFLYPKKGAETFIKILYDNLDKKKILLNTRIVDIDVKSKSSNN